MSLKAYIVHDGEPAYKAALVFAHTGQEALKLGYLEYGIGDDGWITVRAERRPDADVYSRDYTDEAYVETFPAVLRAAGWSYEGDPWCACCDLSAMDGEYPLCPECDRCAECGHQDDCSRHEAAA